LERKPWSGRASALRRPHAGAHVAVVPGEEPVLRLVVEAHDSVLECGGPILSGQAQAGIGVQLLEVALRRFVLDAGPGDRVGIAEQAEALEEAVVLAGLGGSEGLLRDLRLDAAEDVEIHLRDDLPAADDAVDRVVAARVALQVERAVRALVVAAHVGDQAGQLVPDQGEAAGVDHGVCDGLNRGVPEHDLGFFGFGVIRVGLDGALARPFLAGLPMPDLLVPALARLSLRRAERSQRGLDRRALERAFGHDQDAPDARPLGP
jgi:hypothetical protein